VDSNSSSDDLSGLSTSERVELSSVVDRSSGANSSSLEDLVVSAVGSWLVNSLLQTDDSLSSSDSSDTSGSWVGDSVSVTDNLSSLLDPSGTELDSEDGSFLGTLSLLVSELTDLGSVLVASGHTSVSSGDLGVVEHSLGALSGDSHLPDGSVNSSDSVLLQGALSVSSEDISPLSVVSEGQSVSSDGSSDGFSADDAHFHRVESSSESESRNSEVSSERNSSGVNSLIQTSLGSSDRGSVVE